MKDEIKVNKANKSITFINNGIAFSQFGVADEILDYITNLQEENERLKIEKQEEYNRFNLMSKFRDKALERELIYKSRNEKAIEYIKEHIKYEHDDTIAGMSFYSYHLYDFKKDDLLSILQGSDKDDK